MPSEPNRAIFSKRHLDASTTTVNESAFHPGDAALSAIDRRSSADAHCNVAPFFTQAGGRPRKAGRQEQVKFLSSNRIICVESFRGWLGREDSNLRMAVPKTAALPLGDAPMRRAF